MAITEHGDRHRSSSSFPANEHALRVFLSLGRNHDFHVLAVLHRATLGAITSARLAQSSFRIRVH